MALEVFQRAVLDFGGLSVELEYQPLLAYALVRNGVPPVLELSVHNPTTTTSPPLAVRLDLLGPGGLLSEPFLQTVDGGLATRALVRLVRGRLIDRFVDGCGRTAALAVLPVVAEYRLRDRNVRPEEAACRVSRAGVAGRGVRL